MSESDRQLPAPPVAQVERRLYPRYNIKVSVELRAEGSDSAIRLETTDLSRNGCCVAIAAPLSVGTRTEIALCLGEKRVHVRGCIVTRHPQFGNGIMFLGFQEDGDEQLRRYLASLRS